MSEAAEIETQAGDADAKAAWVESVLGVRIPRTGGGDAAARAGVSLVRLGRARLEWHDTLAVARGELRALQTALSERFAGVEDAAGLLPRALDTLERSMATLDDSLLQQLDAVLNAQAAARPPLIGQARATMRAFVQHLGADPVMQELDGNEVRPETAICQPLRQALAAIDAAFI